MLLGDEYPIKSTTEPPAPLAEVPAGGADWALAQQARAFLSLQETAIRAGILDGMQESVANLRAMKNGEGQWKALTSRSRARAEAIYLQYLKYAIPAPQPAPINNQQSVVNIDPACIAEAMRKLTGS